MKRFYFIFCIIALLPLIMGCRNDIKEVQKYVVTDSVPTQSAEGVTLLYSEYGDVVFELISPKVIMEKGKKPKTLFPEGIRVLFYDSTNRNVRSELTANYAVKYDRSRKMIAKGDVVINNYEKGERLNTEELIWEQKTKMIFTDKFVTITTKDQVIYGEDGMESDESFDNWVIKKPTGTLRFKEKEENSNAK